MNDADKDDALLESLFEAARATPPQVPAGLVARLQADALAVQPGRPRAGLYVWYRALGGVTGLGGLATAACVGVWIGVAPPDQLPDLGALALGLEATTDADSAGFGWDIEIEEG